MSIQQNPNQWGAQLPPSPTDALYWREQHRLEARHFQRRRIRPNPELYENVRQYWIAFYGQNNDNDSQSA
jgi:hypothetical protein